MAKKILILNGSPKKDGNTAALTGWFADAARSNGADVEVINTAFLKYKHSGCLSCRACQSSDAFECAIDDDARPVLKKMARADVIVMATPLYFFSASAQLKIMIDRMFSLYKWDNRTDTFNSPLKGKMLVLLASAYESSGLDVLEKPFKMTAEYTGMAFRSLLVPDAGVSGDIKKKIGAREQAIDLGLEISSGKRR
jgi:multimeric flavodoxin WrbA